MRHTAPLIVSLLLTTLLSAQSTWYVNASAPPGGNGSAGSPFTSIQPAVNAAAPGHTVLVAPGTYPGVVITKDIILKSTQGPAVTIITSPSTSAMRIDSTSPACLVEGFKLTNSNGATTNCTLGDAGGIQITNASPTVRGCIISNNVGGSSVYCGGGPSAPAGRAGGVGVSGTGTPLIENCVITGNTGGAGLGYYNGFGWYTTAKAGTGGVVAVGGTTIRHCTIANNQAGSAPYGAPLAGGGVEADFTITLIDSILWGNLPNDLTSSFFAPTPTWCDIGTYSPPGAGNFSANPLFTSDFRLNAGSPCIDAGAPAGATADLDGVSRPQYLQVDVGAFEWRPPAGLTLTLSQSSASVLVGTSGGAPGAVYVNLFTTDPANAGPASGNGRWGGLAMAESIVASQIGLGVPPFIGNLDGSGSASTSVPLPPGLTGVVVYAISHTLGAAHVSSRSALATISLL